MRERQRQRVRYSRKYTLVEEGKAEKAENTRRLFIYFFFTLAAPKLIGRPFFSNSNSHSHSHSQSIGGRRP